MIKRSWRINWIVVAAIVVHGLWGLILLFDSSPLHTTPLGHLPIKHHVGAGIFLLLVSVSAAVPIFKPKLDTTIWGLVLTMPQQWLLMSSVFTAIVSAWAGKYPDGYVPNQWGNPHLFIVVDQLWPIIGMTCHTLSLCDWYWWSRQ